MSLKIIGVGELAVARGAGRIIRTIGLGSCIGMSIYDAHTGVVGMVHVALPDSSINHVLANKLPGYFADTAVPSLFAAMLVNGAPNLGGYVIKLVGGAAVLDAKRVFNIGERNLQALQQHIQSRGFAVQALHVGGSVGRSMEIWASDGRTWVMLPGQAAFEI